MRGLLVLVASGLGFGAFWRRRQRRETPALPSTSGRGRSELEPGGAEQGEPGSEPLEDGPDPADELRAKLAEAKSGDDEAEDVAPPPPAEERSPLDPQVRREDVHARARAALDDLK